jgi:hypothetical protein
VIWTVKEHVGGGDSPYITLYYHSFDGEQGTVSCHVLAWLFPFVLFPTDALFFFWWYYYETRTSVDE